MAVQMQIGNKNYSLAPDVKKIAEDLIKSDKFLQTQNLDLAKIEYLQVSPNISKFVQAKCIKSSSFVKFFGNVDYLVTVSGDIWNQLDPKTKEILVLHELMHIKISYNKKGNVLFQLRDHNVKDFLYIIESFGISWFSTLKAQVSSIYDLDPKEEDHITL